MFFDYVQYHVHRYSHGIIVGRVKHCKEHPGTKRSQTKGGVSDDKGRPIDILNDVRNISYR